MSISPQLRDRLEQVFNEGIPFNDLVGISVEQIEHGQASMSVDFRDELVGDRHKYTYTAALSAH